MSSRCDAVVRGHARPSHSCDLVLNSCPQVPDDAEPLDESEIWDDTRAVVRAHKETSGYSVASEAQVGSRDVIAHDSFPEHPQAVVGSFGHVVRTDPTKELENVDGVRRRPDMGVHFASERDIDLGRWGREYLHDWILEIRVSSSLVPSSRFCALACRSTSTGCLDVLTTSLPSLCNIAYLNVYLCLYCISVSGCAPDGSEFRPGIRIRFRAGFPASRFRAKFRE